MVASSTSGTIFKLDIIKFAKNIMAEVDAIRSYLPVFGEGSQTTEIRPVESRVNAFFRLVGLPMFVSIAPSNDNNKSGSNASEKVITPGFVQGGNPDGIITNSTGIKMKDPITEQRVPLKTLLDRRESVLLTLEQQIGTKDRDNRRVSALYYPLALTLDADGYDINNGKMFKMVSPFVVSYMTICPAQNELSKPFLADPEQGRTPLDSSPIRRPFIETVIRIRIAELGGGNQDQTDYLEGARAQLELVSSVAANLLPTEAFMYEAFIIDQMLGSLDQLADLWIKLKLRQERISKDQTIVLKPKTFSAKVNPFGKQGNFALQMNITDNSNFGRRRAELEQSIAISEAMLSLLPAQDLVSLSGEQVKNVMPNALTNSFVSLLRQPIEAQRKKLNELNNEQDRIAQRADNLRVQLEMMTGEFTGLSVPDVIFTILGLFLIDVEDLVSMLDIDTINEMKKDTVLETVLNDMDEDLIDPSEAVEHLQDKIDSLYKTLNSTITTHIDKNKQSPKNSDKLGITDEGLISVDPDAIIHEAINSK